MELKDYVEGEWTKYMISVYKTIKVNELAEVILTFSCDLCKVEEYTSVESEVRVGKMKLLDILYDLE